MILGFRTKWQTENMPIHIAGKPTHFIEKIWASMIHSIRDINISHYEEYLNAYKSLFGTDFGYNEKMINPKLHTIRRDNLNRWKAGNKIHFYINNRTPQRFRFAPVIKCVSVQNIEIKDISDLHTNEGIIMEYPIAGQKYKLRLTIRVDGKSLNKHEIETLAINDGFDSIEDFFAYFNTDFKGKIIHWTDLKY